MHMICDFWFHKHHYTFFCRVRLVTYEKISRRKVGQFYSKAAMSIFTPQQCIRVYTANQISLSDIKGKMWKSHIQENVYALRGSKHS